MLIVGPKTTCAPLAFASSPRRCPIFLLRSLSKVAPIAVPQGRQAEGMLPKKRVPRTPFGPSDSRIDGIPSRLIGTVCQKSLPI